MGVISVIFYKVRAVTSSKPCNCFCDICVWLSMMTLTFQSMLQHTESMVQMTFCNKAHTSHG